MSPASAVPDPARVDEITAGLRWRLRMIGRTPQLPDDPATAWAIRQLVAAGEATMSDRRLTAVAPQLPDDPAEARLARAEYSAGWALLYDLAAAPDRRVTVERHRLIQQQLGIPGPAMGAVVNRLKAEGLAEHLPDLTLVARHPGQAPPIKSWPEALTRRGLHPPEDSGVPETAVEQTPADVADGSAGASVADMSDESGGSSTDSPADVPDVDDGSATESATKPPADVPDVPAPLTDAELESRSALLPDGGLALRAMTRILIGLSRRPGWQTASSINRDFLSPPQKRVREIVWAAAVEVGAVETFGAGKCLRYRLGNPALAGFTTATPSGEPAATAAAVEASARWVPPMPGAENENIHP